MQKRRGQALFKPIPNVGHNLKIRSALFKLRLYRGCTKSSDVMVTMIATMMTTMITTMMVIMIMTIMIKGSALHGLHRQLAATLQVVSQQQCNALRLSSSCTVPAQDQRVHRVCFLDPTRQTAFFCRSQTRHCSAACRTDARAV